MNKNNYFSGICPTCGQKFNEGVKEVLERLLEEFKLAQNMNQQNILVKLELQKLKELK